MRVLALLLGLALGTALPVAGAPPEGSDPGAAPDTAPDRAAGADSLSIVPLPEGDVFAPLLADPKELRFFGSLLRASGPREESTVGAVGFGERFGVVRWEGSDGAVQVGLSGGVFAQFDLATDSNDLINADYVIGVPVTVRRGSLSARLRLYHQSSHLGDEYLLRGSTERVNLSFESLEALIALESPEWRLYGGGEVMLHGEPDSLERGVVHAGLEYRGGGTVVGLGELGSGRLVAGLDAKWAEEQDWDPGLAVVGGLEFGRGSDPDRSTRRWRLLLEAYVGPSPYGQFYTRDVTTVGTSFQLSL